MFASGSADAGPRTNFIRDGDQIILESNAQQPRFSEAQWQRVPDAALLAEPVRAERVAETRVLQGRLQRL